MAANNEPEHGCDEHSNKTQAHEDGGRPGPTEEADPVSQLKTEVQKSPEGRKERFRVRNIRADWCNEH